MGGEPADRRRLVDLLERLAAAELALDLADEREHRRRVLARRVDADREVGGADGARADGRGRAAGELAVGLGHERGGALVAGGDDPDAGGVEALEQAEEALAGHGEGVADADGAEGVRDEPADGPGRRRQGSGAGSAGGRALARRRPAPRARPSARHRRLGFGSPARPRRRSARSAAARPAASARLGRPPAADSASARPPRLAPLDRRLGLGRGRLDLGSVGLGLRRGRRRSSAPSQIPASFVVGRQVVCVSLRRHRGAAAGAATIATTSAGDDHDGDDDHRDPRVARAWHHGPATGSSRTGAAPPRPSSAQPRDHPLELVLALARDPHRVALDLRLRPSGTRRGSASGSSSRGRRAGPAGAPISWRTLLPPAGSTLPQSKIFSDRLRRTAFDSIRSLIAAAR